MCILRKDDVVIKEKAEMPQGIADARSFGAYNEPESAVYIGSVQGERSIYHYFEQAGSYYYQSESTLAVEKEMKELKKKRKQKRYAKN